MNLVTIIADSIPFWREEWFLILFGALVAGISPLKKKIPNPFSRKAKRDESMMNGLKASADTYNVMDVILELPGVDSVILLQLSNGGKEPKPGRKIYTRAIEAKVGNDSTGERRKNILDEYKQFLVDQHYINMVIQAKESQKPYKFETQKHESCILRTIYINKKVKFAEVHHVFSDTNKWRQIILAIHTLDKDQHFEEPNVRSAIDLCVRRIQHNFDTWG